MKVIVVILLTLISMTSCTITKQRYSNGFHIEWTRRLTTIHSSTSSPLVKTEEEIFFTDTVAKTAIVQPTNDVHSCGFIRLQDGKPNSGLEKPDMIAKTPVTISSITKINQQSVAMDLKNEHVYLKKALQQERQRKSVLCNFNFWEAITDFLFWFMIILLLITIPPVVHTIYATFLHGFTRKSTPFIIMEWTLWLGGIVGILLLVTGVWSIILTCIGWNLLFALLFTAMITSFDF